MFVIYGSTRAGGNSERLAKEITKGLETEEVVLREKRVLDIVDRRHGSDGFERMCDDYYDVLGRMLTHETIMFVTPLYWYGMSGTMKRFIDRWSESLRDERMNFREKMKGKRMYVVVSGGDDPKQKALPLILQFQHIFAFFGAQFEGYVIGNGNKPGDIAKDQLAKNEAASLNGELKSQGCMK
ncbi:flavodoxin family protein [Bacillus sp. H-16]|uniref:flavodoxin family protein n=1 Tax=Alteribacter salitolerans TaxID=2912333 RepID=UPI001963EDA2|nr:flavodoxin family protein [Alteribacter salitolerans]MBM7096194.1 flavodoxin family protein [Alteribacter salitolerans]